MINSKFSLQELYGIFGGGLINFTEANLATPVKGIATDTRTLNPGEIFVALTGKNFDGHNFIAEAIARGAVAAIVSRELPNLDFPQFVVKDTLKAYQQIARWWRERLTIPFIGITGSVGKTTTKELIAAVLNTQGKVLKTQANYNNEIGVPKTLLEIDSTDNYAVIEMAMRATGEIALLTQIAQPTIGIITNVGTAHIGRLGSVEAIAQAKCELLGNMPKSSVAILNYDNPLLMETAAKVWQGKMVTYGLTGGNVKGELTNSDTVKVENQSFLVPLPGIHNASNYLAAIATAKVLGIDIAPLKAGLQVELPQGRSRRYQLTNDIIILDETYNAGLESMLAALQLLKETPGKRYIAVLGTMKELGEHSAELHHRVGEKARELELDLLLVLADEMATQAIAEGATGIDTECFSDRDSLISKLKTIVRSGDRILFKASNSVGLNEIVQELRKHLSK